MGSHFNYLENINLDGFKMVKSEMFKAERAPSMTIFKNEISFSREAHQCLQFCESIQLLINAEEMLVMVRSAPSTDENAIKWSNKLKESYIPRFTCPKLTQPLFSMWKWDMDYRYKVEGRLVKCEKKPVLIFDFRQARAYSGKEVQKQDEK